MLNRISVVCVVLLALWILPQAAVGVSNVPPSSLAFRIAPFSPYASPSNAAEDILPAEDMATFVQVLQDEGPEGMLAVTKDYKWFPVWDSGEAFPNLITATYEGREYLLLYDKPGKMMLPGAGWALESARESYDSETGQPAVSFSLDNDGEQVMGYLTAKNINRHMAIVVGGEVYGAPIIRTAIAHGEGQITMATLEEMQVLAAALGAEPREASSPEPEEANWLTAVLAGVGLAVCAVIVAIVVKLAGKPKAA